LVVSLGRQPVVVPDTVGDDVLTASAKIEDAGLCVGETDGPANTPVIITDPAAGSTVYHGDCIRIVTSQNG
jgi:beta-lactam-binding protein with PASTA domain